MELSEGVRAYLHITDDKLHIYVIVYFHSLDMEDKIP